MSKAYLGSIDGKAFTFNLETLKKHFIALGSSGSGKTVLCKVLIEEAIKNNIPAIIIDPQGDIASLALAKQTNIVIFTPASSKGIPLSINPLQLPEKGLEKEEVISILNEISSSMTQLLGYKTEKAKPVQSLLYLVLLNAYETNEPLKNFDTLIEQIQNPTEKTNEQSLLKQQERKELVRRIKYLTVGKKELLFQFGTPLNIDMLLGKNKDQVSIIYLNTLQSQQEKHFFLSTLALRLYQWMLTHPSKDLQALFYLDEIAEYIPAGAKKPVTKEILQLIFKQARKYGIGCIVSTQNPGDMDYRAFAQFNTWPIGRLTLTQDIAKIKDALQSLTPDVGQITKQLPQLKPGEFMVFSPDTFEEIKKLQVRQISNHKTLTEADIKSITPESLRATFIQEETKSEKHKIRKTHFNINVTQEQLLQIIESKKKRSFVLFGPKENITSLQLICKPFYQLQLKEIKSSLWRKKIKQHELFIDTLTGNIIKMRNGFMKKINFSTLIDLNEVEIQVFKTLNQTKKEATALDLSSRLKIPPATITKTLNQLMKKKLVSYSGKIGNSHLWLPLTKLVIPPLNAYAPPNIELSEEPLEAKMLNEIINVQQLEVPLKAYFNADIIKHKTIYYPYYEVKLSSNKTRTINISAVSGRVI